MSIVELKQIPSGEIIRQTNEELRVVEKDIQGLGELAREIGLMIEDNIGNLKQVEKKSENTQVENVEGGESLRKTMVSIHAKKHTTMPKLSIALPAAVGMAVGMAVGVPAGMLIGGMGAVMACALGGAAIGAGIGGITRLLH